MITLNKMKGAGLVLALILLAPLAGYAGVTVQSFNISTSILMDMYNQVNSSTSSNTNLNNAFINPNVITMQVNATGPQTGPFVFGFNFYDYSAGGSTNPVAWARGFQTNGPLSAGASTLNLNSISRNVQITGGFSQDWVNSEKNKYNNQYGNGGGVNQGTIQNAIATIQAMPFYICVTDANGNCISAPFKLLLFAPQSAATSAANLISPANGAVVNPLPTFAWSPAGKPGAGGASYYILTIGEDSSLSNPVFQSGQLSMTNYFYSPGNRVLQPGTTYYWQVQSFSAGGAAVGGNSGKSQIGQFTINSAATAPGGSAGLTDLASALNTADPKAFAAVRGFNLIGLTLDGATPTPGQIKDLVKGLNDKTLTVQSVQDLSK